MCCFCVDRAPCYAILGSLTLLIFSKVPRRCNYDCDEVDSCGCAFYQLESGVLEKADSPCHSTQTAIHEPYVLICFCCDKVGLVRNVR